jgi:CDP-glycerol glycerophosphotransferase
MAAGYDSAVVRTACGAESTRQVNVRIVYNSFHGRFSDNPRALFERLVDVPGTEHVWLADPLHAAAFPDGVSTVDIDSPRETAAVLASADVLVANTHTEVEWEKSPGTIYLQTWHGTPMKRIHHDVLWAPEGRLARLDHDVAKWDLLLSPNAVSTPRLRGAFRFEGELLELGYPRNDVLSEPRQSAVRRDARARLEVEDGQVVVLYAPTWRDDEYFGDSTARVPLPLDVGELSDALGEQYTVLVRTHNMMTGRVDLPTRRQVRDVSYYPDIRDLYAAADVLVTDYSSTMFDFAVTGRPILFHTPDLERFRDSVRGFYFDLEPIAPGPMIPDAGDLADALRDLPALRAAFAHSYRDFRETFCHLEDGNASDRVLESLGIKVRETTG